MIPEDERQIAQLVQETWPDIGDELTDRDLLESLEHLDDAGSGFDDVDGAAMAPFGPRRGRHQAPPGHGGRSLATALVLAIDVVALCFTHFGVHGALRMWVGLAFVLAVPGWALVGYLRLRWPAAELSLTVALSLAVTLLASEVMLWSHQWHPTTCQLIIGGISAVLLIGQLLRGRQMEGNRR